MAQEPATFQTPWHLACEPTCGNCAVCELSATTQPDNHRKDRRRVSQPPAPLAERRDAPPQLGGSLGVHAPARRPVPFATGQART